MPTPLFLERRSYRTRRMMDAVRVLPFLGVALWMVPLMWPVEGAGAEGEGTAVSSALRYIFAVWLLLIAASFALSRRTRRPETPADDGG